MDSILAKRIDERAHIVMGSHPKDREENDPAIARALKQAYEFCERIEPDLGPPSISGGTTSAPERILMLYWEIGKGSLLGGVYVTFVNDGNCAVQWSDGGTPREMPNLSFDELIAFDVAAKFNSIKRTVLRQGPPPQP